VNFSHKTQDPTSDLLLARSVARAPILRVW